MAKEVVLSIKIEGQADVIKTQQAIRELKKQIREETDPKALNQLNAELTKLQSKLTAAKDEARLAQKAFEAQDKGIGAYKRLSNELIVARTNLKNLAAEGKTGTKEFQEQAQAVQALDARLKAIDKSAGQFQRSVGNYTGALNKAANQIRKTQRAFNLFVNLPFAFSGIIDSVQQLIDGIDTLDLALSKGLAKQREVTEVVKEVSGAYLEQVGTLDNLFDVAQDQNKSDQERQAALDAINAEYAELLPNEKEQLTLTSDLTAAQNALNQAIINQIVAEQKRIQQQEAINQFIASQRALAEAQESTINSFVLSTTAGLDITSEAFKEAANDINIQNLQKNLAEVGKFGEDLEKSLSEAFSGLEEAGADIGDIFGKGANESIKANNEKLKASTKETNAVLEGSIADLKNQLSEVQKEIQQQTAVGDINALTPLVGREQDLQEQINIAEQAIKDLRGLTEQEQQKQLEAAEKQRDELLKLRNELLLSEQELLQVQARQRADQQKELVNELAQDEIERAELIAAIEQNLQDELTQIDRNAQAKRNKERIDQIQESQDDILQAYTLENLRIEEELAKGLISASDAAKKQLDANINALKDQIQALENDEALNISLGVELSADEQAKLIQTRQELNTQLAQLEAEYTETVKQESTEQLDARQQSITSLLNGLSEGLSIIEGFADAAQQRTEARLDEQLTERQNRIEGLQEELNEASGLEAEFITQQIELQEAQVKQLEENKIRSEREAAKVKKGIAISESIINTAVAVTSALPNVPLAVGTGIAGAAQTAIIAAQPLATGGIVGKNIRGRKIRRSNGDDTLTTLKTGEVVLNKTHQAKLGGDATFRAIGVPGFASGGRVGSIPPPSIAANVAGGVNSTTDLIKTIKATNELAVTTANKLNALEVVFTDRTQDQINNDNRDKKEVNRRGRL